MATPSSHPAPVRWVAFNIRHKDGPVCSHPRNFHDGEDAAHDAPIWYPKQSSNIQRPIPLSPNTV